MDPVLLPPQVRGADQVAPPEIILPRRGGQVGGDEAQLVHCHIVHEHQELLLCTHEKRKWTGERVLLVGVGVLVYGGDAVGGGDGVEEWGGGNPGK